ncbi:MAG: hypothetical protein M3238_05885 [Actinomycetota bacterium]|nr:hypothetical protein [Actinomycetota bacterium]
MDSDRADGGDGDDHFVDTGFDEKKHPHDGNDFFDGGAGIDTAHFGQSEQGIHADLAAGRATGQGRDRFTDVEGIRGSLFDDNITGDDGANRLNGEYGKDIVNGRGGPDLVAGGPDDDQLDGGEGIDTVSFEWQVIVNLAARAATGEGSDVLDGLENVTASYGSDILIGDGGPNVLDGGRGRDKLRGLDGDDRLLGGPLETIEGRPITAERDELVGGLGNDVLNGAWGRDLADFGTSSTGVVADLTSGTATGEGTDSLVHMENLAGSGYDDTLIGDDERNGLRGRPGNDILRGSAGDDLLDGGINDDRIDGGDGIDTLNLKRAVTAITVDLLAGTATGEGSDSISFVENMNGSIHADVLTGDTGVNTIIGNSGRDTIHGGAGNDVLNGMAGDDTIFGGDGDDEMFDFEGFDRVSGEAGDDYFRTGIDDDHFDGGPGIDTADFVDSTRGMSVDLVAGTTSTKGDQGSDTISFIETVSWKIYTD